MIYLGNIRGTVKFNLSKSPIIQSKQHVIMETNESPMSKAYGTTLNYLPQTLQSCASQRSLISSRLDQLDGQQRDDYWLNKVDQLIKDKKKDKALIRQQNQEIRQANG